MSLRPLRAAIAGWAPHETAYLDPLQAISAAWPEIVGRAVAARTAPLALTGQTLVVSTASSAWSQQLQLLSVAILTGVRAVHGAGDVSRLTFRTGGRRRIARGRSLAPAPAASRPDRAAEPPVPPAKDPAEALARLRARVAALGTTAAARCERCDSPLAAASRTVCAPCAGALAAARMVAVQRLLFSAPWLSEAELRSSVPGLSPSDLERARRALIARWWTILERAKWAGRLSRSGLEREVASSYLLLQSQLPPERITPAVVRNLLGPELEALLWGSRSASSKETAR